MLLNHDRQTDGQSKSYTESLLITFTLNFSNQEEVADGQTDKVNYRVSALP